MAQLVQTFSGDTALRLQDEEFVRKMFWGTNWRKVRICVHHAVPGANGNISPNIYIGVCQGTTNTFKSVTTTDWAGGLCGGAAWTYAAGPPGDIHLASTNPKGAIRSGNVTTATTGPNITNYIGTTNRDWWVVEITKTATGFLAGFRTAVATPAVDLTSANFAMLAAQENGSGLVNTSVAVTYAGGYLWDSVSVYWDFAPVGYEISEIQVIRLQ